MEGNWCLCGVILDLTLDGVERIMLVVPNVVCLQEDILKCRTAAVRHIW